MLAKPAPMSVHAYVADPHPRAPSARDGGVRVVPEQYHSADLRQAQLFIELLRVELADLKSQQARSLVGLRPEHMRLRGLRVRINEVNRLIDALQRRFPAA